MCVMYIHLTHTFIPHSYLIRTSFIPHLYLIYTSFVPHLYLIYTSFIPHSYLIYTSGVRRASPRGSWPHPLTPHPRPPLANHSRLSPLTLRLSPPLPPPSPHPSLPSNLHRLHNPPTLPHTATQLSSTPEMTCSKSCMVSSYSQCVCVLLR